MNRRAFGAALAASLLAGSLPLQAQTARELPLLSVMLWTLSKLGDFDRSLEIVSEAGYGGVELVGEFHKWSPAEWKQHKAKLRALRLRVDAMSGVVAGFSEPAKRAVFLEQFAEQMRYAQELECRQVILLSGAVVPGLAPEAQFAASVEALQRAGDMAAKNGMEIVIEPIDRLENPTIFLSTVREAFRIAKTVGQPGVGVLYDLYHEQRGYGNLLEKLEGDFALVRLVHVADVPGRHEPGTGEICYSNVYGTLARLGYRRAIAMEFYPSGEPVATLREAREAVLRAYAGTSGVPRQG